MLKRRSIDKVIEEYRQPDWISKASVANTASWEGAGSYEYSANAGQNSALISREEAIKMQIDMQEE